MTSPNAHNPHLPEHVAIIMDGNGRWAKKRNLPRHLGHRHGALVTEGIVRQAHLRGIKYLTLYAFSSENWLRPKEEVDAIMKLFHEFLENDPSELIKNGIKLKAIGDLKKLPPSLERALMSTIDKTKGGNKLCLTLALSYGSWGEFAHVCRAIAQEAHKSNLDPQTIDESTVRKHLYTSDLPDPDLFIRTAGEKRLSNFLLMQASYSELYFSDTLWPDFKCRDFDKALEEYAQRSRRFGKLEAY